MSEFQKMELKGNSDAARTAPVEENTVVEERRIDKVISGEATEKKKSSHLFSNILANDFKTACRNVIKGVLIPAAFDTICDFGEELLRNMCYGGEVRRGGRSRNTPGDRSSVTDYHRMSNRGGGAPRESVRSRDSFDLNNVVLKSYYDADKVLESLDNLIYKSGYATVGDLYSALGWGTRGNYTVNDYGWTKLGRDARIVSVRDEYVIELPEPRYIADIIRRGR